MRNSKRQGSRSGKLIWLAMGLILAGLAMNSMANSEENRTAGKCEIRQSYNDKGILISFVNESGQVTKEMQFGPDSDSYTKGDHDIKN